MFSNIINIMTADELYIELKKYIKENNKFPTVNEFSAHTRLPYDTISKVFKRWILMGKLIKNGSKFETVGEKLYNETVEKVTEEKPMEKTEPEKPAPLIESVKIIEEKTKETKTDYKMSFLRIIIGIIGILLVICSIHFTFEFNRMSMKTVWALILSISVVSFMSIAFTMKNHTNSRLIKSLILFLWFLGISYSVFTAVSGQYNDFKKYVAEDITSISEEQKKIYNSQLNEKKKKKEMLLHWRNQETEYNFNPNLKTENPKTWKEIQKGVEELKAIEKEIDELQEKILNIVSANTVSTETVYSWLARVIHIKSETIHFIMILFLASFIDLCSGICLSFAFEFKIKTQNE